MNRKTDWCRLVLAGVWLALPGSALAQSAQPLFAESESAPLALTIEGPFRTLQRHRRAQPELPGVVRYADASGRAVELDVQLRTRGVSRLSLCDFPPLRLNFKTKQAAGTLFEGQDKLKLVTHCKPDDDYRAYIAQEYEIYRAYNVLTPYSFRVRWASIDYRDTDTGQAFTEPGFLIEEENAAAERLGMKVVEVKNLDPSALNPRQAAQLALFHYMIGNTDWSPITARPGAMCCHNGALLAPDDNTGLIVLPYDFDQSGLIDAAYAAPADKLEIKSVTERLYRGYCALNDEVEEVVAHMNAVQADVIAAFDSERVAASHREWAMRYVHDFYALVNDPQRLEASVLDACR
jgi:hypothetical protein